MQTKSWIALGAIALATGSAFAAPLNPRGDAADYQIGTATTRSVVTRSEVKQAVIAARAAGELQPAGEASGVVLAAASRDVAPVRLSRAEVKAATLRARAAGELVPAGEDGPDGTLSAHAKAARGNALAAAAPQTAVAGAQ